MSAVESPRRTKFEKLYAVFDQFHLELAKVPDDRAAKLCSNWQLVKQNYHELLGKVQPSKLATGLEQGLRELPIVIESIAPEYQEQASEALRIALRTEYPDFLDGEKVRLAKIIQRGKIRGEAEYYLVRFHIDLLEGDATHNSDLAMLYKLADQFEEL